MKSLPLSLLLRPPPALPSLLPRPSSRSRRRACFKLWRNLAGGGGGRIFGFKQFQMGLAQAEQKEVREREEGGSAREQWEPLPAPAGGQRRAAAGRHAGGLAGWSAGGGGVLGFARIGCSQGQEYSRLPAGEEATWHSPSLSMSLWASLSLHLTVCCSPLPSIPAVWSQPARVTSAWPIFWPS